MPMFKYGINQTSSLAAFMQCVDFPTVQSKQWAMDDVAGVPWP
jgi:hypothetical protein